MRLYDWEARLSAYISKVASTPFEYGVHDCALFAAGGVEALTGENPAAKFVGKYHGRASGRALTRGAGFADHVAFAESLFPRVGLASAMPGDLAVIDTRSGPALGIVQGAIIFVLRSEGIGIVPAASATQFLAVR